MRALCGNRMTLPSTHDESWAYVSRVRSEEECDVYEGQLSQLKPVIEDLPPGYVKDSMQLLAKSVEAQRGFTKGRAGADSSRSSIFDAFSSMFGSTHLWACTQSYVHTIYLWSKLAP